MKKLKITLTIITFLVFISTAVVWAIGPKVNPMNTAPSEYGIGTAYEIAMKDNKPFVALFYSDWCTYCKRFMPKYKILSEIYKDKYNFVMINIEDPNYTNVAKEYAIGSLPTIYVIDPTIDNRVLVNNTLYEDLGKIRTELERYLRIRAMINK